MSSAAQAAPVQFAGFTQTQSGSPIVSSNVDGSITGSAKVSFSYSNVGALIPAVLNSPIAATVTVNIQTAQSVVQFGVGSSTSFFEAYDSATIAVIADNTISNIASGIAGKNLLTLTITDPNVASILALKGTVANPDKTPNFSGSGDYSSSGPSQLKYTSDFLPFASMSNYTGSFNVGFILQSGLSKAGNFFGGNTASIGAQFSSEPPPTVPEPASIALVGLGLIAAPVVLRRRRQASSV